MEQQQELDFEQFEPGVISSFVQHPVWIAIQEHIAERDRTVGNDLKRSVSADLAAMRFLQGQLRELEWIKILPALLIKTEKDHDRTDQQQSK